MLILRLENLRYINKWMVKCQILDINQEEYCPNIQRRERKDKKSYVRKTPLNLVELARVKRQLLLLHM